MSSGNGESNLSEIFRQKYEAPNSDWGQNSGPGSVPIYTIDYRVFLEKFIFLNAIRSVTDIGCGDWSFSRFINYSQVSYLGLDVVESVIARNKQRFETAQHNFALMPPNLADLPGGDLLVMKDVLQHLPNQDIMRFHDIVFPKFKYCLITNSYEKHGTVVNEDVAAGGFRCLDLASAPFNFAGSYVLEFPSSVFEKLRVFLICNHKKK